MKILIWNNADTENLWKYWLLIIVLPKKIYCSKYNSVLILDTAGLVSIDDIDDHVLKMDGEELIAWVYWYRKHKQYF